MKDQVRHLLTIAVFSLACLLTTSRPLVASEVQIPSEPLACPPCDDGDLCTTDYCSTATSTCVHLAIVCDDGSPCTSDTCSPTIGCVFAAIPDGSECSDANACTTGDHCQAGACNGTPVACDDGNACTYDFCDGSTGQCVYYPQSCFDGNPCTVDTCDPATALCQYAPRPFGDTCDDNDSCTTNDRCVAGANGIRCAGTTTFGGACDDGQPCTVNDQCVPGTVGGSQCLGMLLDCNDANACTNDYCDGTTGQCLHDPLICDDFNPCTTDSCGTTTGCQHQALPTGTPCDDTEACTIDDACAVDPREGVVCKGTPNLGAACDDGSTCTYDDQCVPGGRFGSTCSGTTINCEDGDPCTTEACHPDVGACVVGPRVCNDYSACTNDACSIALGGCEFTPVSDGAACDDYSPCTSGDQCQSGTCVGTPLECDDGNPCTVDFCENGCVHIPIGCSSGVPCTQGSCDPSSGQCIFTPLPDATPCFDGNPCTTNETCQAGSCLGSLIPCDDGNTCTSDSCDFMFGCVNTPLPDGVACDDGSSCTTSDACLAGSCSGTPVDCADNDACTTDSCDPQAGCVHTPVVLGPAGPVGFANHFKLQWLPSPDATQWNSYRGSIPPGGLSSRLPGSVYDHTCFESADEFGDGATASIDASSPPPGWAWYYDVTGESACGEGPLGSASSGSPRPNAAPCPTPP